MRVRQEKGSALLIVLGMVAFIVISAVAFSAYMRYSRAPSSFLRQTISSRMLAKAALAEAIDEIDAAIGNNPHPGVGNSDSRRETGVGESDTSADSNNRGNNLWVGRVFIKRDENGNDSFAKAADTVSTLCYEALAYIPPALINEARYYSRYSNTAIWKNMDFDVGRYAYTAIDVSDFFDVNILRANAPRSSAPGSRITLSYLFEDQAPAWDKFMEFFRDPTDDGRTELGGHVPLVSVADLNLAIGKGGRAGIKSPFCEYDHQGDAGSFYGSISLEDIATMTFITDSWFPAFETANALSLDLSITQPFDDAYLNTYHTYEEIVGQHTSPIADRLKEFNFPFCSKAALFDYLDKDNIPVSLSLPTAERVPMVCGIKVENPNGDVKVTGGADPANDKYDYVGDEKESLERTVTREYKYTLELPLDTFSDISAVIAYPFRHQDGVNASFDVSGLSAVYFTSEEMKLRADNAVKELQFVDYKDTKDPVLQDGVLLIPLKGNAVSTTCQEGEQMARAVPLTGNPGTAANLLQGTPFIDVSIKWKQTRTKNEDGSFTDWTPDDPMQAEEGSRSVDKASCAFTPLKADGSQDQNFKLKDVFLGDSKDPLILNFAVWVRVMSGTETVDMVPASVDYDRLNPVNHNMDDVSENSLHVAFGGAGPLLRFDTAVKIVPTLAGLNELAQTPPAFAPQPQGIIVSDPRFNFAPECWVQENNASANAWYTYANGMATATGHDGDLYMSVSDQGYMQSVYELGNLIRASDDGFVAKKTEGGWDEDRGNMKRPSDYSGSTFATQGSELNVGYMWRTYDPFGRYGDHGPNNFQGDAFEDLNVVSGGTGFRINPYSDSTNVMMAAFANTPHDWRCCSTNNQEKEFETMTADAFNREYSWSEDSSGAKINYTDLEKVAGKFMEKIRENNGASDWEDVWAELWKYKEEEKNNLVAEVPVTGSALYNTDKKFLYGYWHDCFAVKQQLFLIFLRAEPSMMGGGQNNTTPPQLGARAVALVWRDPRPLLDGDDRSPHRTRILFYRQFD